MEVRDWPARKWVYFKNAPAGAFGAASGAADGGKGVEGEAGAAVRNGGLHPSCVTRCSSSRLSGLFCACALGSKEILGDVVP